MGVKGLTPFLKKIHPDIFKELPNRFEALKGKKIVIDGTLLTQRFHFARIEHPYRHILGWFKLAQELRENDVKAICIFDGKDRSVAKAREVERRHAVRQLARVRGSIEQHRFDRLHRLQESIRILQVLTQSDKEEVLKRLKKTPFTNLEDTEVLLQPDVLEAQEQGIDLVVSEEEGTLQSIPEQQVLEPILAEEVPTETLPLEELTLTELPVASTLPETTPKEPSDVEQLPTEPVPEPEVPANLMPAEQISPETLQAEDVLEESLYPEQVPVEAISVEDVSLSSVFPASPISAEPYSGEEELQEAVYAPDEESFIDEVSAEVEQSPMLPILLEEILDEVPMVPVFAEQPIIEELPEERLTELAPEEIIPGEPIPTEQETMDYPAEQIPIPMEETIVKENAKTIPIPVQTIDLDKLVARIESLKTDYEAAVASLTTLTPGTDGLAEETPLEQVNVDQLLTKSQTELAIQEDKLWTEFVSSLEPSAPELEEKIDEDVDGLLDQSFTMAQNFEHRSNAPAPRTYQECKEILRAMGIPCLDAMGAAEAEGLASSIVLEGLADYVASEDTDVLIYDAPLIRGVSGSEPLVTVSGPEIRNALDLDREAFIDFALLLGTDFTERISNVGPVRAYQFIKDHGCIEDILTAIEDSKRYKLKIPVDAYLAQVNIARKIFNTPPLIPPQEFLQSNEKDDEQVAEVLERYNLTHALTNDSYLGHESGHQMVLGQSVFGDNPEA